MHKWTPFLRISGHDFHACEHPRSGAILKGGRPRWSAPAVDFRGLEEENTAHSFGPPSARIQVTLFQDFLLLAALLDPAAADLDTSGINRIPGAVRALERYFVSSKFDSSRKTWS
jgi:hypothetical protein